MKSIQLHLPSAGMLFLNSSLTHLGAASMKLFITAQDGGGLAAARPAEITVNVLQSAQTPAVFQKSRYTFTVPEDAAPGTHVGTVQAVVPMRKCEHSQILIVRSVGNKVKVTVSGSIRCSLLIDLANQSKL